MVDFHKVPFVILAVVVLVIAGSLAYFWRTYEAPLGPEYDWGSARTLRLDLVFDRTSYSAADTINLTGTITNFGPERVRLFPWDWAVMAQFQMINRTSRDRWLFRGMLDFPSNSAPRISDSEFNRMLVVLAPNGTYSRQWSVGSGTIWNGPHGWPWQPGFNWSFEVECSYNHFRPPPALPIWIGHLESDRYNFTVLP